MVAGQSQGADPARLAHRRMNPSSASSTSQPPRSACKLFLEAAARESGRRRDPSARADGAAPRPPSRLAFILAGLVAVASGRDCGLAVLAAGRRRAPQCPRSGQGREDAGRRQCGNGRQRFVSFDGTSAAELYRDVLQLDAANERARTGLEIALNGAIGGAPAGTGRRQAGRGHQQHGGRAPHRAAAPRACRSSGPQVDTETQRAAGRCQGAGAMLARQAQIRAALDKMQASIRAGALLDPAADNAITQFQEAQSLSPGDPAVRSARSELTGALVAAGEKAVSAKHMDDARRYATATGRINSSASGLAALLWHIDEATAPAVAPAGNAAPAAARTEPQKAPAAPATTPPPATAPESSPGASPSQPAAAQAAQREGTLIAGVPQLPSAAATPQPIAVPAPPPAAAAQHAPAPADEVVSASKLKVLRTAPAEYPREALDRLESPAGWNWSSPWPRTVRSRTSR